MEEEVLHLLVPMPHHPNIAADPDAPGPDTNPQRLVPHPSSPLRSDCPRAWHAGERIASRGTVRWSFGRRIGSHGLQDVTPKSTSLVSTVPAVRPGAVV
jgi:hypothetical protein